MTPREIQLAKIEIRIKEIEDQDKEGKVIIIIKDGKITGWQSIVIDKEK